MGKATQLIVTATLAVAGLAAASPPATESYLASVGRGAGKQGSQWYTTVWLYNPGSSPANVQLFFLQRGRDNSSAVPYNVTVQPGDVLRLENAVYTLFGVEGFGALRVVANQAVVVNSRIFSQPPEGEAASVGQFFAAVPASFAVGAGERTQLLGVYQTTPEGESTFRYNYGLVETTGQTVTVRITAYDGSGAVLGSDTVTLRPYEVQQWNVKERLLPSPSTTNARIEVEVIGGSGKVVAFGSGLANVSNDPSTFEMQYAAGGSGGSISGVTAGAGLTGGGSSGAVTLDVGSGKNIVVGNDAVALADTIDVTAARAKGSNGTLNAQVAPNPANANYGLVSAHNDAGNVRAEMWSSPSASGLGIIRSKGPNDSTNVLLTASPDNLNLGQLELIDDQDETKVWGWLSSSSTAGNLAVSGPNLYDNVSLGWNSNNPDRGFLTVWDENGAWQVEAFSSSSAHAGKVYVYGPNGERNGALSAITNNPDHGYLGLYDGNGNKRVDAYVSSSSYAGIINTFGPNGSPNIQLGRLSSDYNHGWIGIYNAAGSVTASISSIDGGAVVSASSKSVSAYPGHEESRIVYSRLEGPESGLYLRGRVTLADGRATITLPDHFVALADLDSLTVHLTPHSLASHGVAVDRLAGAVIHIGELAGGRGSYEVSYLVQAVRRGRRDEPVVMSEGEVARHYGVGTAAALATSGADAATAPATARDTEEHDGEGGRPDHAARRPGVRR